MKTLFSYMPIFALIIVLFTLESSIIKWILLAICAVLMGVAKYTRTQMNTEEIEYDERVNNNISKWSLRFTYIVNALLFIYIFIGTTNYLTVSLESILIVLLLSLFIPFYIIPSIAKKL